MTLFGLTVQKIINVTPGYDMWCIEHSTVYLIISDKRDLTDIYVFLKIYHLLIV